MIELIFTIDYELFGNGSGSLKDHVYIPAQRISQLFEKFGYKLVFFIEVAEFIKLNDLKQYQFIDHIERQIRNLKISGHEIGLHIHSWWYNAINKDEKWVLDYNEYNTAILPIQKIEKQIVSAVDYLKRVLKDDLFQPTSFRAGNWLIQPSKNILTVLKNNGIKIDSSVFKKGYNSKLKLDFRRSPKKLPYWNIEDDVLTPQINGSLVEIPIYSEMKPIWCLWKKSKNKVYAGVMKKNNTFRFQNIMDLLNSFKNYFRIFYPFKFDFTKMPFVEMKNMLDNIIKNNKNTSKSVPIVIIGHTKNLPAYEEIEKLLIYIKQQNISVTTFKDIITKLN